MSWFKSTEQETVAINIFVGNGSRLADRQAIEDYHANAIVSDTHRMAFKMRKPVRLYRHIRDGLAPSKTRSQHIFSRTELPPGMDLDTMIQMESVWYAGMTGTDTSDEDDRKANVILRSLAVIGGIALPIGGLIYKASVKPEDAEAAMDLAQVLLRLGGMI